MKGWSPRADVLVTPAGGSNRTSRAVLIRDGTTRSDLSKVALPWMAHGKHRRKQTQPRALISYLLRERLVGRRHDAERVAISWTDLWGRMFANTLRAGRPGALAAGR